MVVAVIVVEFVRDTIALAGLFVLFVTPVFDKMLFAVTTADIVAVFDAPPLPTDMVPRIICFIAIPNGVQFVLSAEGSVTPPPFVFLTYAKNVIGDIA